MKTPTCRIDTLGGQWGGYRGQSNEETPQRVISTRWGLMGWAPRARRRGKPPTCQFDTLGVDEVGVERGKGRKPPNVSIRHAGGSLVWVLSPPLIVKAPNMSF